jgi:hypothetical protein
MKHFLKVIDGILVHGSILAFDDWNCYRAEADHGERKAFQEFVASQTNLSFVEFLTLDWHGMSFIVHHCSVANPK